MTNPALIEMLEARVKIAQEAALAIENDPAALRVANAKLRNARLALARVRGTHTTSQWKALVAETGGFCVRCGYDHAAFAQEPCKGYIVPIAAGGSNAIENIQPLCRTCASARGNEQVDWLERWREAHTSDSDLFEGA